MKFYKKYFKKYKVVKHKTKNLIKQSSIILFFDSSVIVNGVVLKKKIFSLQSEIFKGHHYNSDQYSKLLKTEKINLEKFNFETIKKILRKKKTSTYNYYIKNYLSRNLKEDGNKSIVKYLENYFF